MATRIRAGVVILESMFVKIFPSIIIANNNSNYALGAQGPKGLPTGKTVAPVWVFSTAAAEP